MKLFPFPSLHAPGALALLALLALHGISALPARAEEKSRPLDVEWRGGFQGGYSLGQNGQGWPQPWREPLANNNRGGFYLLQARAQALIRFDSTFSAVVVGNLAASELQEAYIQKSWGTWRVKAGKLLGAGLESATGMDEFAQTLALRPRYARVWNYHKQLLNFRDYGIQGEKDFLDGRVQNRLFFHNANGENVINDEPSFPAGKTTQALGIDYALSAQVSPYSTVGGHVGARADRQWDDFLGNHDFWDVGYWLKQNAVVDGSFFHRMDFPRLHVFNEAMALANRTVLHPGTDDPWITWGASTLARFDAWRCWSPFLGYEFFDNSDGIYKDDALHMVRLGTLFRPAPEQYPDLRITGQYTRALEEGGNNLLGNDILYVQVQSLF
ncbi:MAG TPA: hypothetical protein VK465_02755 [Fibrobacteria bacterium]|nr:hypothetical protein [Fibrobacteria bacterium]